MNGALREDRDLGIRSRTTLTSAKNSRHWLLPLSSMANNFAPNGSSVDPREIFHLGRPQKRLVRNVAKIIRHHPDIFLRCHPLVAIEAGEIYGARVAAQGAFTAQVEINVEVTQSQFAQGAVDRLTVTAPGKV